MLFDRKLKEIRKDMARAGMDNVTDQEYIDILTKHTSNLVDLIEQLSHDSEQRNNLQSILGILFKNVTEPICVIDNGYNILFVNQYWIRFFGKDQNAYQIKEVFSKADYLAFKAILKKISKSGKREILMLKESRAKQMLILLPLSGFGDEPKCLILGVNENIGLSMPGENRKQGIANGKSSKIKAENAEGNRNFIELTDGFFIGLNRNREIQYISPEVKKVLGYKAENLAKRSIDTIIEDASVGEFQSNLELAAKTNSKLRFEIKLITHSGVYRYFEITVSSGDHAYPYAIACIDIHRFKQREDELNNEKENAELNDKLKSDFLANMSHEIRTPLNGIVGFSTMLNRKNLEPEKRDKYIRIIKSSTMQLLTLVNDIIDHSKIEAGRLKIIYHPVDVHVMLDDLQATFVSEAQRLEKKNIRLIKRTGKPSKKLMIKSDEVRLKQVLANLLGNALKFTDEGEICFGYDLDTEGSIRFYVKDNGLGLSKSAQRSIFQRYKQTQEGEKVKYKGTGLGLAISKGIVELMGGKIGVSSEQNNGSEFYVLLPLTRCD